ncbi:hypothetical protein DA803_02005 [[Mycoplasma] phocae]|uniref:Uncharacterized protein n=1 Tax=[Mycoplasma] phocae TaxID=142651 RepID=A0A2Z5IQN1_9BACT|nr:SGNH/GDSL hydrolase family protein [[Mycoplasma] phocae]AXE60857.1 hypothetical protein DA803_02005 [[Mycoplasma] phocae]
MKKNKKFAKKLMTLGAFIVLGSAGVIAASCTTKIKKPTYERLVFDQSEVSGQIDYVALGDDYAAGNNYSDNNYLLNEYNIDTESIQGVSYASYFANAVKELKDSKTNLRSYKNYGLSGSTIEEWLYLLNPEKYRSNAIIEKNFEYNKNLMAANGSKRLEKTFGNFENSNYNELKDSIKRANLITLSLGYNDFFATNDIFNLLLEFHNIDSNLSQMEEKLKAWLDRAEQVSSFIYENYDRLLTEIRRINPNANITLVGYTNPFLKLSTIIKNQFASNKDYVHEGLEILNKQIKAVALSNNVNFVSYYNEEQILNNPSKFSSDLFEMFPSVEGYKKLAQDLFMKLALGESEYNAIISDQLVVGVDNQGYKKSILFDTKSDSVKSAIVGDSGDGLSKKYDFESQEINQKLIDNQNSGFNANIFGVYKAQFNNGMNMSGFELIEYFFKTLKIVGIDLNEYRDSFTLLEDELGRDDTRNLFIEFINTVFDSQTLDSELKSFNKKANELIRVTPPEMLTTKAIAKIYYEEFSSPDHIYNFFKEIAKSKFVQDPKINKEFREYLKPFMRKLTSSNLYKAFFDLLKVSIEEKSLAQIDFELQLDTFVDSMINLVFDEPNKYSEYSNYIEFLGALTQRSKVEIKTVLDSFVTWLQQDKIVADKIVDSIAGSLIDLYKIDGENAKSVREFVRIFVLNFNKLKNSDVLVGFIAESFSSIKLEISKTPTVSELFATFIDSMITDRYDANNENKLLFTLASANLGQTEEEKKSYQAGLEVISLSFIAKEDFFDTQNTNYLENNQKRERLFKLLTNLIKDKDKELTQEGRQLISNVLGRLVEQAFLDEKSDLNVTIKKLLDYFIIEPLILNFKNNFKGNDANGIESIEKFIRDIWATLWSQIKNKDSIDGIKNLFAKVLERAEQYDNESLYAFVISVFKDGENNKLYDLIKIIVSQLTATDGVFDNVFNKAIDWIQKETKHTFSEENKAKISAYSKEILKNAPNTTLYDHIESKVKEISKTLDKTKQRNFEEFSKYFGSEMNKFLTVNNKGIVPELLDVFLARDRDNKYHIEFNRVIETLSLFFKEDKIIEYIINKFDLKTIIESTLDSIKFKGENSQKNWQKVLIDLKKFINDKYTNFIIPTIRKSFNTIFSDKELIKKSKSFTELIVNFITQEKEELKKQTVKYVNELLLDNKTNLKNNISELIVSVVDESFNNVALNDNQKLETKKMITKLLDSFTKFKLTEKMVEIIFNNLEKNIKTQLFNFSRYDIKLNLVEIFNGVDHSELINFIKELTSSEVKNISIIALKNWKIILNSFITNSNESNSNNQQNGIFELSGDLKISSNVWLTLFKETFSKLDEQGKNEIKGELNKILVDGFSTNVIFKQFIKNQFNNIKNQIIEKEPLADKLLSKIFDSTSKTFEDQLVTNILKNVSEWLVNLDGKTINSISELNMQITTLLNETKEKFVQLVKKTVKDQFKEKENTLELSGLIFDLLNQKYELDASNINSENIKLFISRLFKNIGNSAIIDNFIEKLIEKIFQIKLLDEEFIFSKNKTLKQTKELIDSIKFDEIFSKDNLDKLFSDMLKNNEVDTLKGEIVSLYEYITTNLSKLKELKNENKDLSNKYFEKLFKDYKKYIIRTLNSINKTIKDDGTNKIKNSITDSLREILKKSIDDIEDSKLENKYIAPDKIKKISRMVINYDETKNLINNLITKLGENEFEETGNYDEILWKVFDSSEKDLITDLTRIITRISSDDKTLDILVDEIFRFLSLENVIEEDKTFFKNLIKKMVPKIQETDFYKKKVMNRLFKIFKNKAKPAGILNFNVWIKELMEEFVSIFSLRDVGIFVDLIGEGNVIDGPEFVKLINLILGKSNLENSFVYNSLKNINNNPDALKRSNIDTLNNLAWNRNFFGEEKISDDPDNVKVEFDPLAFLDKAFKLLAIEVTKEFKLYKDYENDYLIRYNKEAYKATYRFLVALKFAIFEMFGRETIDYYREVGPTKVGLYTSKTAILWEIQEGSGLKWISNVFKGMQNYFLHTNIRRELTNYVDRKGTFNYYYAQEENYTPSSIDYLIVTSGYHSSEQNKLVPFKYKVTKDGQTRTISKRDYILLTIREGGFAKFMKINNEKSNSSWSGLDKVDFSKVEE